MSNVLDLKHQQPGTPLVSTEVPELPSELESEVIAVDTVEEEADIEDVNEALLAGMMPPSALSWEAHHPLQGHARWRHFIFSGCLVGFGVLMSLWQSSAVPALVMLAAVLALEIREHWGKPVVVDVDEKGIAINGQQHEHASFASFHIHRMPDDTLELSLKSCRRYLPHVRLPLGEQDPHELHAVMTQYIPEGVHKIPLVEYMLRKPKK